MTSKLLSDRKRGRPDPRNHRVICTGTTEDGKPCRNYADRGTILCRDHNDAPRCAGTNADGSACKRRPMKGTGHCFNHTPEAVAARDARAPRCEATNQATGERCPYQPLKGQKVCQRHGGNSPHARRAGSMRVEEERARSTLARLGEAVPIVNALLALQKHAAEVVAFKDLLACELGKIKVTDWRYKSQADLEQIHGLVLLFERAQDRCTTTLTALARVQVDDRLAAVEEAKANMIMDAFAKAILKAGITDGDKQALAYGEFGKRLKVIAGTVEPAEPARRASPGETAA